MAFRAPLLKIIYVTLRSVHIEGHVTLTVKLLYCISVFNGGISLKIPMFNSMHPPQIKMQIWLLDFNCRNFSEHLCVAFHALFCKTYEFGYNRSTIKSSLLEEENSNLALYSHSLQKVAIGKKLSALYRTRKVHSLL
jgi:hypothetical protein